MRVSARHKRVHIVALLVLLLSLLPSGGVMPQAVSAEGRVNDTPDTPQAPNADTGKEIVYIDNNGFIRVFDPFFTDKQVQWVSPTGGWRSVAVGDFDGDGDMEIVAIRGNVGSTPAPELAIFDPVVATGAPSQGQEINGIPWKQLFTTPLPGNPQLVFAGNFDPNVPGDEIGISRQIVASDGARSDDKTRVIIYKQTSLTPTGTSWTEHVRRDFSQEWDRYTVGNIDNAGADEIGFVDQDKGEFNFYRPDAALAKINGPGGSSRNPMRDIAVGQYIGGGNREVLVARKDASNSQNTFEVYGYNGSLNAVAGSRLSPGPRVIAAGDINGSGDDEAIMVRYCNTDGCVRLIVRNDGGDGVIQEFLDGLPLDTDDGFRAVAAGDIDGDGRDEIIIMRDTKIRYFPDAHNSARFVDENVRTNGRTLVVGDLDRNGFISGPVIEATPARVDEIAYLGFVKTGFIELQNVATNDAINFTASVNQPWMSVSPIAGAMPGRNGGKTRLTYSIDARAMPVGTFNANITVVSSAPNIVNSPYSIPMTVTVQFPPFGTSPESATAFYYPCEEPLAEQTLTLNVVGVPGTTFTASVFPPIVAAQIAETLEGDYFLVEQAEDGVVMTDRTGAQLVLPASSIAEMQPSIATVQPSAVMSNTWPSQTPWVTAAWSNSNVVPTQLSLTISPTVRTANFAQTTLILAGSNPLNPGQIIAGSTPIRLACASQASWLPLIGR